MDYTDLLKDYKTEKYLKKANDILKKDIIKEKHIKYMTLTRIKKLCRIKKIKLSQNGKFNTKKFLINKLINNITDDEETVSIKNPEDKNTETINKSIKNNKKEVQKHGFIWEKDILCNIYGATEEELKTISYVSKIDLPAEFNRLDGCDLSIKTTKSKNMVCMGDCLRVYDTIKTGRKLHMVVLHYKQNNNIKEIQTIIEIDLTNSINELFGNISREQLVELNNIVKNVPHKRKPTDDEHKNMYDYRNEISFNKGQIMLNIKCDSRQRIRFICSLVNHK